MTATTITEAWRRTREELVAYGKEHGAPEVFFRYVDKFLRNTILAKYAIDHDVSERFYIHFEEALGNFDLLKYGIDNKVHERFYIHFDQIYQNPDLATYAIDHGVHYNCYIFFKDLLLNTDLAKYGIDNNASKWFYVYFNRMSKDPELARYAIDYNKHHSSYIYFKDLFLNRDLAKYGMRNLAPSAFYVYFDRICTKEDEAFIKYALKRCASEDFYSHYNSINNPERDALRADFEALKRVVKDREIKQKKEEVNEMRRCINCVNYIRKGERCKATYYNENEDNENIDWALKCPSYRFNENKKVEAVGMKRPETLEEIERRIEERLDQRYELIKRIQNCCYKNNKMMKEIGIPKKIIKILDEFFYADRKKMLRKISGEEWKRLVLECEGFEERAKDYEITEKMKELCYIAPCYKDPKSKTTRRKVSLKVCQACGAEILLEARFCSECGGRWGSR